MIISQMELKTNKQQQQKKLYNLWRNALTPFENFVKYLVFLTADNIWRPERDVKIYEKYMGFVTSFFCNNRFFFY